MTSTEAVSDPLIELVAIMLAVSLVMAAARVVTLKSQILERCSNMYRSVREWTVRSVAG